LDVFSKNPPIFPKKNFGPWKFDGLDRSQAIGRTGDGNRKDRSALPDLSRTGRHELPIYSRQLELKKMVTIVRVDSRPRPIIIGVSREDAILAQAPAEPIAEERKAVFRMAGPQFITPRPVSPSRSPKKFKLAEANRSLPLVRRIVGDIVKTHKSVTALQASLESAKHKDQQPIQAQLDRQVEILQGYVDELHGIGCDLKDYQIGLVDFVGRHRGHDVCLCWKLGEETIAYWHEIQTGFAGRQPVSILEED